MKNIRILLLAGTFAVFALSAQAAANAERFNPKSVSPRYVKVGTKPVHTIAAGGQAQCEVVIPEGACPVEKFAARELSEFLGQIIGAEVPVTSKPTDGKTSFLLGRAGAPRAGVDLKTIDRDGFVIRSVGENIVIAGTDHPAENPAKHALYREKGTLYAVYEFLERFGGVRFYFPGDVGTIVPSKPDWKIGSIDLLDRPDSQHRQTYCVGVKTLGSGKLEFYEGVVPADVHRLSALRMRRSTLNIPNCHGLRGLELPRRFAKTHPEYFALMDNGKRHDGHMMLRSDDKDGHLCFSNEELKNIVYEDAKAFLTGQPASSRGISVWRQSLFSQPFFNIMPNDALYECRCERCKAMNAKYPHGNGDVVWQFKTDIARRLQQENIPGFITVMAYGAYKPIPPMDIPSNVIVMLAVTGPWKEFNPDQKDDYQLLKDWNEKLKAKTYLWTYTTKIGSEIADIPSVTPKSVGTFFRNAAPYSFGAFLEAETDVWLFNAMNFYVFGKVLWNNSTDVDALLDEHFRLMYGPAAAQMKEFYDTLERHWVKDIRANTKETSVGPVAVLPSQYEIWTKIYSPAEIDRVNALFDKAEKLAASDPASLKRVQFMRKELWGHVLAGLERFNKFNSDSKLWTVCVPEISDKITVDGKLDESAWQQAKPVWMLPRNGDEAEVHTRVRMLCDAENFYIGFESDEPFTDQMLCAPRQDQEIDIWRDNVVEVFFAGKPDSETFYQIMFNSDGKTCDLRWPGGAKNGWRSGAEFKPGVVPGKMWVAEIRVPRSSMPDLEKDKFLVNFTRGRVLKQEKVKVPYYTWSRFQERQTPDRCGTAIVGKAPVEDNFVAGGDFDLQLFQFQTRTTLGLMAGDPFWYGQDKGGPLVLDRAIFRTRGQSVRLEMPGGSDRLWQYIWGLESGKKYRLSFYVKLENVHGDDRNPGAGLYVQLRFGTKRADTVFRPMAQKFSGNIPWTRLEYEFTTPEGTAEEYNPYFEFVLSKGSSGKVWIDHVEIQEVKETAAPAKK